MLEITRELVEHYLRATGWAMAFGSPYVYSHPDIRHDLVLFGDYPKAWLPAIAEALSQDRSVTAFRLGLCAAAEMVYPGGDIADIDPLVVGALLNRHIDLLDAADIDHAAWESARAQR